MKTLFFLTSVFFNACMINAQNCHTGKLDSRVAVILKTVLSDLPSSPTTSVEQIRDVKIQAPDFPLSDILHLKITADSIPVQVYNPAHATGLPIIISYHPGGFVTPILPFMEYEFWRQAKTYNCIVFAVDYRVAPENKYPLALNDSYNAYKWIAHYGQNFGGDTSKIVLFGISAGGNLAAVICQKAKKEGISHNIKLQILNCPSTDNPRNFAKYPSYQQNASGYFLTKEFCQYYIQAYAPGEDIHNPEIAPIQSQNVSGLPPAVICTAEFDPLHDEGFAYSERLRKAKVPLWYKCFSGQIHCLIGLPPESKELKEIDNMVLNAMDKVFNR